MLRIGVFVFFDYEGIVDDYVEKLLFSMQEVLSKLYIVVNGKLTNDSKKVLEKYANYILFRENAGYDAGAYKNIILDYFSVNDWNTFDEIVLFNNTFYGPFFSMGNLFEVFSSDKDTDFWGLSRWIGGESTLLHEKNLPAHIQAYFIVIKRNILQSNFWLDFWKKMNYPNSYTDAIRDFEVRFTTYFSDRGFRYKTWLEEQGGAVLLETGKVVYDAYPYELISNYRFPILKHKVVNFFNFSQVNKSIEFIEKNYNYDTSMIWNHLERSEKYRNMKPFSIAELEKFYLAHDKIYIFGYGKCGKGMKAYFSYRKWDMCGFVVSANQEDENLILLESLKLDSKDGIIVALGKKNCQDVQRSLREKFDEEQILFPDYVFS